MTPRIQRAVEVARRQSFGDGFMPMSGDVATKDALLDGRMVLRPHPEWVIPSRLTWDEDPFGETNWQAQFNMLRWLDPLRRCAAGDDRAARLWENLARDWVGKNIENPRNKWVTEGMVAGIRSVALTLGIAIVPNAAWILSALERHLEWLSDGSHRAVANHALWQITGHFVTASALGSRTEQSTAVARLEQHVEREYDDEGINHEGSVAYHLYNYRWTRGSLARMEVEGFQVDGIASRLDGALKGILHSTRPDGFLETIGDTAATRLSGVESAEVDYLTSGGSLGSPPSDLSAQFSAGYAYGRTGWGETRKSLVEESFYSLRWGPADRVHGHLDGGSVTYYSGSSPVLVDSGKYGYNKSRMRAYVNSRAGHNVADVRGVNYDRSTVVDLVDSFTSDSYDAYLIRDKGYVGALLERSVVFDRRDEWLLTIDRCRGEGVSAVVRWHLDPRFAVKLSKGAARAIAPDDTGDFSLTWVPPLHGDSIVGQSEPAEGWVGTGWNQAAQAAVVRIELPTDGSWIATLTCATSTSPEVEVEQAGDRAVVKVSSSGRTAWVVVRGDSAPVLLREPASGWRNAPSVDLDSIPAGAIDPEAVEAIEGIVARIHQASAEGVPPKSLPLEEMVSQARRMGFNGTRDYGLGSALGDLSGERSIFPARRSSLRGNALTYMDRVLPLVRSTPESTFDVLDRDCVHVVHDGPLLLQGLYLRGESRQLFVGFAGAVDRGRTSLPLFQGVGTHRTLPGHSLLFSDPTLDLDADLRLGWYLGTASVDAHRSMANLVAEYARKLDIDRIVLVGGSGGGFAALQVAAWLGRCAVVAFSPQTSVWAYHQRFRDHALETVFGTRQPIGDELDRRLSVISRYEAAAVSADIIYVQNTNDSFHVEQHAHPFRDALRHGSVKGVFNYREVSMGLGHASPTRDVYLEFVAEAAAGA